MRRLCLLTLTTLLATALLRPGAAARAASAPRAAYRRYSPIISFNLDRKDVVNRSLRLAVRDGHLSELDSLHRQGGRVNSTSDNGETALMYAARYCRPDEARWLLKHGATINTTDHRGRTALIHAARFTCLEVARLLLRQPGIRARHRDSSGRSAADYAVDSAVLWVDGPPVETLRLLRAAQAD